MHIAHNLKAPQKYKIQGEKNKRRKLQINSIEIQIHLFQASNREFIIIKLANLVK